MLKSVKNSQPFYDGGLPYTCPEMLLVFALDKRQGLLKVTMTSNVEDACSSPVSVNHVSTLWHKTCPFTAFVLSLF